MGTQENEINWDELLAELRPKPGSNGDCYSAIELAEAWRLGRDQTRAMLKAAIESGLLIPVKIPAANVFGDIALKHRYRLAKRPSKRTAQRDKRRPNAHSNRR